MTAIYRTRFWSLVHGSLLAIFTVLFLATSSGLADAKGAGPALSNLPKALLGAWKVEAVLVDLGSSRTLLYQRDDSRLVGNTFTISDQKIESNAPEARACLTPRAAIWKTTAGSLVAVTLASHGYPGSPPTVKDYELPLAPAASVEAFSVKCDPGRFGPRPLSTARAAIGSRDLGSWIVVLPGGNLALRWYDETILILRRAD